VLVVGAILYVVMADPDGTRRLLPSGITYPIVHASLTILLLLLIGSLISALAPVRRRPGVGGLQRSGSASPMLRHGLFRGLGLGVWICLKTLPCRVASDPGLGVGVAIAAPGRGRPRLDRVSAQSRRRPRRLGSRNEVVTPR